MGAPGQHQKGFEDLTGQQFGWLRVLELDKTSSPKTYKYICECKCGRQLSIYGYKLRSGERTRCYKNCKAHIDYINPATKTLKRDAEKRKIVYNISNKYLWKVWNQQSGKCAITGLELYIATWRKKQQGQSHTASVDRIDSSKGYVKGNIQWVHKTVNQMKWDLSQDELIKWCNLIAKTNPL